MPRASSCVVVVAAALAVGVTSAAKDLTSANFDDEVFKGGKNFAFVKFLAPWCGHCKKLKPDWDKLGDAFNTADSKALIADVDCTEDSGKDLCQKYGVQGYPTIKYFTTSSGADGETYEGARDYNGLKKFVKKMSKDPCVLATLENCNKKEKAFIEELGAFDDAKAASELATMKGALDEAKKKHQDLADRFEQEKDIAMATMKEQEEAKKEMENITKTTMFKINLLEQKTGAKKEEL